MARFRLLTFNCFGVPAPGTPARLRTLAHILDHERPDVVCLQEVQWNRFHRLLDRAVTSFPYRCHEPFVHAPKGGLMTLSQFPIERRGFTLYRHRGWWHSLSIADWLLHKGVLVSHLAVGETPVVVVNTHLLANYDGDWRQGNRYAEAERSELAQLAELVARLPAEALVVAAGDFNVPRDSWLCAGFTAATGAFDPLAGCTAPTFRPMTGLPARFAAAIDHVYVRPPAGVRVAAAARLRFAEPVRLVNGRLGYLSDHLGVEVSLEWGPGAEC